MVETDITVFEVGPRDGLQNEPEFLATDKKIELIRLLSETGLKTIEASSFVRSDKIPQLADCSEILAQLPKKDSIQYPVLVPNVQGLELAINAGVKTVCVFTTISESFCQKNTNCSIAESLERIREVCNLAKKNNIAVRGYISCVFGCPYEGKMIDADVIKLTESLLDHGCYEISLGDTTGVATAGDIRRLLMQFENKNALALHCHDTYGQALANIYCAIDCGLTTFDASIGGLGGCPYAKGATGNVATEDLVYMLDGLGLKTGIDLSKLLSASRFIKQHLPHSLQSRVAKAMLSKD